ncbi:NAD-dependent epimerase/dehydratase family protein [Kitasatospora viridis]|uniref:Nucleoside-diphosphate-sugar epimerase n=1 Tax=Kitasatospora viridis TaxID=281105 RepID=A0A561UBM7_9ACTN|nr:NAD-dependent epimerase/dehydratase family protein [Kitasatospora viridis]TWF96771.1 nucleoside-diphosphate-sugar epimerase [Kitasatospora viridis]
MRLLVLGGTEFVGRAFAEEAVARGWEVTLLNRGNHPAPEGVRSLWGHRLAFDGLRALDEGDWDIAVDTWSGAPAAVRAAARRLAGRVGHYLYVSSRSVYAFPTVDGLNELAAVEDGDPGSTDATPYGAAKRGGELAAQEVFGERALLARAGLVLGPHENVGRLPWWLNHIARGGRVLAPGPRELPIQYLDARDLARWGLDAAAAGLGGAYNLVSPPGANTMGDLVDACVTVTGAAAEPVWLPPEALAAAGVEPWTQLPVWIPPGDLHRVMHLGDTAKAATAGLRCRPLQETVADTWAWLRTLPGRAPAGTAHSPTGITEELERRLLGG